MKKYDVNRPIPIIFAQYNKKSFMNQHLAISLIVCYLTLTFAYSIIEKIIKWQDCTIYYTKHFKKSLLKNHVIVSILLIIFLELVCVSLNTIGLYNLIKTGRADIVIWGMLAVSLTLILLMTGQRIAQDYSGAMNITVYFILTVLGLFMLETL